MWMSQQHHLGYDANKELSHLDFWIHAHVGLDDNILSQKELKSMSKAICLHTVSIVELHDLYHVLKLAQDCLFVRLGMS